MTDTEAVSLLSVMVCDIERKRPADLLTNHRRRSQMAALRHALQAIEDRAEFVAAGESEDWLVKTQKADIVARRHMKGED